MPAHAHRAAVAFSILVAATACHRIIEEEPPPYIPDVERICDLWCDKLEECGYSDPAQSEYTDLEGCLQNCNHDDLFWWVPCNREYEVRKECRATLTCQELADQSQRSDVPREQQPCYGESEIFSDCHTANVPEDWDDVGPPD